MYVVCIDSSYQRSLFKNALQIKSANFTSSLSGSIASIKGYGTINLGYLFRSQIETEYHATGSPGTAVTELYGKIYRTNLDFPHEHLTPEKFARALYFAEGFNMIDEAGDEESS